jgi:hypothetical protein
MRFCNFHMSEKWHVFYSSMIIWAGTHLGTLLSLHRGALQSSLGVPGPGCAIEAHMDDIWPFSQHALSVWHLQSCWMWQIGGGTSLGSWHTPSTWSKDTHGAGHGFWMGGWPVLQDMVPHYILQLSSHLTFINFHQTHNFQSQTKSSNHPYPVNGLCQQSPH